MSIRSLTLCVVLVSLLAAVSRKSAAAPYALEADPLAFVIVGSGSLMSSPMTTFQVAWVAGTLTRFQISMRLVTGPLRFVPEPSSLALGALGLTSLAGLRGWRGSRRTRR